MKAKKVNIPFEIFNTLFMLLMIVITLYPLYYIVMASFSNPALLIQHRGLMIRPCGFSTLGYKAVLGNHDIYVGYSNTLFYVIVGTALSLLVSSLLAYALTKRNVKYSRQMSLFVVVTMFFSGGMIPIYLVVRGVGLLNTRWAVILPGLINVFNLIILKTSFLSIPDSITEAATIDGANDFIIWSRIIMPLSTATIAVFVLYTGVAYWNGWFNAMIYLKDRKLYPLQLFLREIIVNSSTSDMANNMGTGQSASLEEVIKYSTIIVSTVPILCIYPFVQKYFVNGVMIGAVKG